MIGERMIGGEMTSAGEGSSEKRKILPRLIPPPG